MDMATPRSFSDISLRDGVPVILILIFAGLLFESLYQTFITSGLVATVSGNAFFAVYLLLMLVLDKYTSTLETELNIFYFLIFGVVILTFSYALSPDRSQLLVIPPLTVLAVYYLYRHIR